MPKARRVRNSSSRPAVAAPSGGGKACPILPGAHWMAPCEARRLLDVALSGCAPGAKGNRKGPLSRETGRGFPGTLAGIRSGPPELPGGPGRALMGQPAGSRSRGSPRRQDDAARFVSGFHAFLRPHPGLSRSGRCGLGPVAGQARNSGAGAVRQPCAASSPGHSASTAFMPKAALAFGPPEPAQRASGPPLARTTKPHGSRPSAASRRACWNALNGGMSSAARRATNPVR